MNKKILVLASPIILLASLSTPAPAQAVRALQIMREVEQKALTDSQSYDGALEVADGKGKVLKKSWKFWRAGNRGSSRILVRFESPAEVRGVGLLTLNHPNSAADQWLYTPAIQRERRIAAQEKSQRFMGTDFTHEDMEERSIDDYEYDLVGEEMFDGKAAYKIKAICKESNNTQYSQLYLWVRKDISATTYLEYYIDGKLRKTLRWDGWEQIQGVWTPRDTMMKDLQRGSITRMTTSNVRYNLPLEPDWFSLRNLRRVQ